MKKTLTIIGPTAVGKTDLTVKIAENINGEIRKRFVEGYDLNKLCLHWYNIFKNLDNIEEEE